MVRLGILAIVLDKSMRFGTAHVRLVWPSRVHGLIFIVRIVAEAQLPLAKALNRGRNRDRILPHLARPKTKQF